MPIILSGSIKGGSGKSTLSVNLAAMRAKAGKSVLLVDCDHDLESASMWAAVRSEFENLPRITCVTKRGKIGKDVIDMQDRFDTIIIDTSGGDCIELRSALAIADTVLITIRPSQFDMWSLSRLSLLLKDIEERIDVRVPAVVLLNAVNPNPFMKEGAEVRKMLEDYADALPALPFQVSDRVSFRRAVRDGMGVCDLRGGFVDEAASKEMETVYKAVFK